jgi:hypothetical protein
VFVEERYYASYTRPSLLVRGYMTFVTIVVKITGMTTMTLTSMINVTIISTQQPHH